MTVLATDGRFSDCDPATINVEPTLGDLEKDVSNCYVGQYAITGDLVTGIAQALAQGLGVVIAIWCDTAFQNYTANSAPLGVPNFNDPQGGGHCIYLHGYYTAADGSKVFRGRNSWSTQWGKNGDYEMSSAAIACIMDARAMVAKKVSQ
jgi:C1A family cysteine protease